MSASRKFAIAGNVGSVMYYWTGEMKRVPWHTMKRSARTWCSEEVALKWLPRAPKPRPMMDNLRVVEVAP